MTRRALPVIVLVVSCVSFMFSTAQVGQSQNRRARQHETVMATAQRLKATGFDVEQDSLSLTTSSRDEASPDRQPTISAAQLRVPGKARDAYRKAWFATREKKPGDAVRYIEKALSICPQYAEALSLRAILEAPNINSRERARDDAKKAIEYDPNFGAGYIVLGSVYNSLRQFDDAVRTLDRGIALLPASWQGYYEMSVALVGKGDFAGGLRQAERASNLGGNYPDLHLVEALAYVGLKNRSTAAAELKAFRSLDQRNPLSSGTK